jgi:PAS domain S-box-containing protein
MLAASIILTILATFYMKFDVDVLAKREFIFACNEVLAKIDVRLKDHEQILLSGAALFDATDQVTREQWRTFVQRLNVESNLPGIQGIGFALRIPPDRLAHHVKEIRSEGFPNYNVRPEGDRDVYSSIICLEPFLGRNLRAFGYDMLSEPVRRAAMERARDQNEAALSGKVVLVQETDKDIQAGTLMYVPVYRKGMPTETVEQRREALFGWVYSPYRMTDLMRGILGGWDSQEGLRIRLQVYDGTLLSADTILYDSQAHKDKDMGPAPQFTEDLQVVFNGSPWTLRFIQAGGQVSLARVWFTLASGMIISLLLFVLTLSLLNSRFNALQMAERLTTELRASEERWQFALEGARDGVWDWNAQTNEVFFSRQWKAMLGFEEHEIGTTLDEWDKRVHTDDKESCYGDLERHFSGETPFYENEHRVLCKDGNYKWILDRGKVMEWMDDGKPLRVIGTHMDMTDRKRAEQEKENLRAQLLQSQKMETMGTLAAGIAHDFNNMLAVILGYSSMLLADKNEKDPGYKGLQKILKTSQDAADLVQRIRIFGRKAEMNLVPLDLNHQIDEVIKLLSSTLPKTIDIDIHLTKDTVIIRADSSQIAQMVMNLAVNANEAMPQGGRLSIQTENIVLDDDYCRPHVGVKPGPHVMLTVSDTGRGIDKGLMERIFDPFYSTKMRDYHKGTGLGLSVVQGIVQQHGGHITVESEVGQGTTFRMYFPALEVEKVPEYVEKEIPYPAGGNETILLVEDWEMVRKLGVTILEKFGYTVLSACDGQEALEVYEKEQGNIALVVLDIIMPRMDGKQCLEQLLRINPTVKVIISSGVGHYDLINDIVKIGAKGAVNKPYGMRQLLGMVREVLDGD